MTITGTGQTGEVPSLAGCASTRRHTCGPRTPILPDGSLDLDGSGGVPPNGPLRVPMPTNAAYLSAADAGGLLSQTSDPQRQQSDDESLRLAMERIDRGEGDPEALHRQVFAEERTHIEQSEEFRNFLSSSAPEGGESPAARERREAANEYNEMVLQDLMSGMDEMEEMAPSREEAMRRRSGEGGDALFCSECGMGLGEDTIQLARAIGAGGRADGGSPFLSGVLCRACHARRLRSTDEARVRLGAGAYRGGESPPSLARTAGAGYAKGTRRGRQSWEGARRSGRGGIVAGGGGEKGMSGVPSLDTSSLFRVPEGDAGDGSAAAWEGTSQDPRRHSSNERVRRRRRPPMRTPRSLGGRELARRMQRQQGPGSTAREENNPDRQPASRQAPGAPRNQGGNEEVEAPSGSVISDARARDGRHLGYGGELSAGDGGRDSWVRVEDPVSKRMLYWNEATGEMKKTLD